MNLQFEWHDTYQVLGSLRNDKKELETYKSKLEFAYDQALSEIEKKFNGNNTANTFFQALRKEVNLLNTFINAINGVKKKLAIKEISTTLEQLNISPIDDSALTYIFKCIGDLKNLHTIISLHQENIRKINEAMANLSPPDPLSQNIEALNKLLTDHCLKDKRRVASNIQYFYSISYFMACFLFFIPKIAPKSLRENEEAIDSLKEVLIKFQKKEAIDQQSLDKLRQHLPTLRHGEIGNIIRNYIKEKKLDALFEDTQKPRTVTEFINQLCGPAQKQVEKKQSWFSNFFPTQSSKPEPAANNKPTNT